MPRSDHTCLGLSSRSSPPAVSSRASDLFGAVVAVYEDARVVPETEPDDAASAPSAAPTSTNRRFSKLVCNARAGRAIDGYGVRSGR